MTKKWIKMMRLRYLPVMMVRFSYFIGEFIRYHYYRCAFKKVGKAVSISRGVSFGGIYNIEIGSQVSINQGCNLYGDFGIKIGDNVRLSPYVQLYSANYKLKKGASIGSLGTVGKQIIVGNNVWIGAGSIVLSGVKIGSNSVIGALSLVNKDIPEGEIWAGDPIRFVTKIK